MWLKENNHTYNDITIDCDVIENVMSLKTCQRMGNCQICRLLSSPEVSMKMIKAQPQSSYIQVSHVDNDDEETVSGVLLPKPGVNVEEQMARVHLILSGPGESEAKNITHRIPIPIIPWPTRSASPASEFTSPYFFCHGFSLLVPNWKIRLSC